MKNLYLTKELTLKINICVAEEFWVDDKAIMQLRTGFGDKNISQFTEEEFKEEITKRNLVVVSIREDPIAYAIVHDGKVVEHYVEWMFKGSKLEELLLNEAINELK